MNEDILLRLRVRETHGIRRFLYPLRVGVNLPVALFIGNIRPALRLTQDDGAALPWQIEFTRGLIYLEFAVSLAPLAEQTLILTEGDTLLALDDPLQVTQTEEGGLRNQQKRFALSVTADGALADVVYDGIAHLQEPSAITRNGEAAREQSMTSSYGQNVPLKASLTAMGYDKDRCGCRTVVCITAVKSWATVTHTLDAPKPNDEIVFTLPFAAMSPTLTCDFGVGGGLYAKLQAGTADTIVWRTEFMENDAVQWSIATNGRMDYAGIVDTLRLYHTQQWFHIIDSDKALAVAMTQVPLCCRTMTVTLNVSGNVEIAFVLGDPIGEPAEFGVCYHFLNDVPAIAAATNPQSILLPPIVDVLP